MMSIVDDLIKAHKKKLITEFLEDLSEYSLDDCEIYKKWEKRLED